MIKINSPDSKPTSPATILTKKQQTSTVISNSLVTRNRPQAEVTYNCHIDKPAPQNQRPTA
jgi:hypothetical protein